MHTSMMMAVNSAPVTHRDNLNTSTYHNDYATIPHRVERPVQPEDNERSKKDKKWSFGKLFRRKKKEEESPTSSESDEGISTRLHKKQKKKPRVPAVNNFDHIVVRDTRRAQSLAKPNQKDYTDDGVLSDPSAGFINYRNRLHQNVYGESKDSLLAKDDLSVKTSVDGRSKKTRKGRLKARVEALRNSMKGDSSSDEESIKSSNSSSMIRFRSDDSLMRSRDSSLNKRSRSARNERYVKRLSRDEENVLNKEAELLQQGYTKAEVEMLTRTPTSQSSGYGTCKRDQCTKIKQDPIYSNDSNRRPMKSESVSSFPSTQSYPSSINFNAKVNSDHIHYSIPYSSNHLKKDALFPNNNRQKIINDEFKNSENVMCVKFPLGNVTNIKRDERAPPAPPPRDLQRKVSTPLSMYYENNSIVSDRMDNKQTHGVPNNDFERVMRRSQERSLNHVNGLRRPISNSEDHIAMMNNEYLHNFHSKNDQPRRPASVSAEPNHYVLYANTPPWRRKTEQSNIVKPEPVQPRQDFLYFADQSPRSRKPISIKSSQTNLDNQYLSDSQASLIRDNVYRKPKNASEFWKKIDDAEKQRQQHTRFANNRSNSDCLNNSKSYRNSQYYELSRLGEDNSDFKNKNVIKPGVLSLDTTDGAQTWKATTEYKRSITVEPPKILSPTTKTHVRHKSDTFLPNYNNHTPSDEEKMPERRKSTNLDDALNELEAIYNSLGLGDEDLLDRAERRELMTPMYNEQFNDWNGNDKELQLRSQPTTPLRRFPRRSTLPDKLQDDMAFRRLNSKEKQAQGGKDTQSQISYMLASPAYVPYASDDDRHSERNEPDVVFDDVVYRNIKQTNNRLKTIDPQPPFGIPVVPVTPAPQSDYLHATPEHRSRSRFIPRRSPDLVSDDLAYRSLRKDNRHSSLFNGEDYIGQINNNYHERNSTNDPVTLKKKRAIRSLSANIFTMIQKEIDDALNKSSMSSLQKTQSNSDVTRRLREVFENNDINSDHYPRNKVKQRHNTVNLYVNNIHAPNHHFAKDDSYIHNDDKHLAKPPYCDKSKSSSPSNRSPQAMKKSSNKDEFQHVLTILAQEAMDTSNKLGVALAELDKNRNSQEKKSDIKNKITDSRLSFLSGLTSKPVSELIGATPEVKYVNVHSEVVNQPKLGNPDVCIDNSTKAQKTADSLLAISNQLHKVEDQLKHSFEKEVNVEDESLSLSSYMPKTEEQLKARETTVSLENKQIPDVVPHSIRNDSIKIQNSEIHPPVKKDLSTTECNSPNISNAQVKEISEIQAFKDLKDGISDLLAGITQVNEKLFVPKTEINEGVSSNTGKIATMAEVSEKLNQVNQQNENKVVPQRASVNLSIYEDDLEIKRDPADSAEYNSSEELATIFKLDNKSRPTAVSNVNQESTVRNDLSSPKLVKTMNQQLRRFSVDSTNDNPSQSNSLPTNIVPWRTKRQNDPQNEKRGTQSSCEWHRNPGTLMLACSYTMMITQHLADLDWLTLLGLILAIVTIIAMILI